MKTSEFNFFLPEHLVAQEPSKERGQSRLMLLDRVYGKRTHTTVLQLADILCSKNFLSPSGEKPLLVFNDTKVKKARLIGKSCDTGAEVEFLLLEPVTRDERCITDSECRWKVLVQHAKRRKPGSRYVFYDGAGAQIACCEITGSEKESKFLKFDNPIDEEFLEKYGHVPLPPYIKRNDTYSDTERYQTIYARLTGSAAAPTAGLHFTRGLLDMFKKNGIDTAFITLHVGLGTFLPVHSENIEDHLMHEEQFIITDENASIIEKAVEKKKEIIAVGTTSLRALETCAEMKKENGLTKEGISLKRGWQSTSIFIYPGYKFKITDALFTNFHTPASTLLMLVCAFAGKDLIMESYKEAVKEGYRFFSYGDAMLIY
ncbi:MAG: tRNA preQ1(34) S-adenosylmethionine ribosyltransferase-isomerase QueA [Treponema sp.]|nr:tRNA preQ1(34) S-adenosylmethionine ribosyltransferase-isomerase QueA [Treponema sp.]